MTLFYQTQTWSNQEEQGKAQIDLWKHVSTKKNWRIVQLSNGFYQTEYLCKYKADFWRHVTRRETIEEAEEAIDETVAHYANKLEFIDGPKVVKSFK
jgi:hypothetical protein